MSELYLSPNVDEGLYKHYPFPQGGVLGHIVSQALGLFKRSEPFIEHCLCTKKNIDKILFRSNQIADG